MSKTPQEKGLEFEKRFAELIGGEVTPGSGNQWYCKLDVGDKTILWSLKWTGKESLPVTRNILHEAIQEATKIGSAGMIPGLAVDIAGEDFILLRAQDFAALLQEDVKLARPSKAAAKRARANTPLILRGDD